MNIYIGDLAHADLGNRGSGAELYYRQWPRCQCHTWLIVPRVGFQCFQILEGYLDYQQVALVIREMADQLASAATTREA